ncbi:unnamed protein product [Clavelina lepadiformis]|uniref:Uncharacterized protein n=1 Tax=Clavelina lepadiformis TaxID=159417 RepID=A0ABP0EX57_CLALP
MNRSLSEILPALSLSVSSKLTEWTAGVAAIMENIFVTNSSCGTSSKISSIRWNQRNRSSAELVGCAGRARIGTVMSGPHTRYCLYIGRSTVC